MFQSLFIESCGLINIQLCRNQQNCPFYVISDQAEDISRLFGVQLYLSGTIGAFHVPAIDDKKIISLSGQMFYLWSKSRPQLLFQGGLVQQHLMKCIVFVTTDIV